MSLLILLVLSLGAAVTWLTGDNGPLAGAKMPDAQKPAPQGAPAAMPSLLLGANVERQTALKAQAVAAAAVSSLVTVEVAAPWQGNARRILDKFAAEGLSPGAGGHGFFVDHRGLLLTNFSALLNGYAWTARTADGATYDARFVGADPAADLALLRIDREDTTPVRWASSPPEFAGGLLLLWFDARFGPRAAETSASSGVLEDEDTALPYFLINHAAAARGGLLLERDGTAAGIVSRPAGGETAVWSVAGLVPVIELMRNEPLVQRACAGLECRETAGNLLVTEVRADGPAKELRPGDAIVSFADAPVKSAPEFCRSLARMSAGTKVPIAARRDGELITAELVLREQDSELLRLARQWLDATAKSRKDAAREKRD